MVTIYRYPQGLMAAYTYIIEIMGLFGLQL